MNEFRKIVLPKKTEAKSGYSWATHLRNFENGRENFIPVDAFNKNLPFSFNDALKEGVVFEIAIHDYDKVSENVEVRWFARVDKVCGYRVLAQFLGCDTKFWINFLSEEVYSLAHAARVLSTTIKHVYSPPLSVSIEYAQDMKNFVANCIEGEMVGQTALSPSFDINKATLQSPKFRVGQRIELLNYTLSTEIRVARIQKICGRRLNVLVCKRDYGKMYPNSTDDRQLQSSKEAQYWIDEASFFIFPVGFAAVNGYNLFANADYKEHTRKIAECIANNRPPVYDRDDVTFDDLRKEPLDPELWSRVKVGQKFELIDPLAQSFKNMHVASILKFCKTDGYMIVGMDGPDALEESFPIHVNNMFMFPVGYAEKNNVKLEAPEGFKGIFKWNKYLRDEGAESMPIELFNPMPSTERLNKFQVGMRLEAADMCENHFICPATISSMHGRVINVNFDGWDSEFDEMYDVDSHDIFPIGWCELHNYTLQYPRRS
ncbi:unnamed protein product [Caenorhabditis sp. 36 PRJEB53466]|nr:unnamed protein product [Caenorhabditis sp. 36 PRJEB53466]